MAQPVFVPQLGTIVNFPDDASNDQIAAKIKTMLPQEVGKPTAPERSLYGAFSSGIEGLLGSAEATTGALVGGVEGAFGADNDWSKYFYDKAKENFAESRKYQGGDVWGAKTWGDMGYSALEGVVQTLPQTAIAGALSSIPYVGIPAAFAVSEYLTTGQHMQRQAEENNIPLEKTDAFKAAITAAPSALLDTLSGAAMARGVPEGLVASYVARQVIRAAETGIGRIGVAAISEGLTEPAQQAIEIAQANPEKLYDFPPEVRNELLNAATIGFLAGGTTHVALSPIEAYQKGRGKQLQQDLASERMQNAASLRQGRISQAAENLRQSGITGPVDIVPEEIDGLPRYSIKTPEGEHVATFVTQDDAVKAVDLYKSMTGTDVMVREDVTAPEVFPVKINDQQFNNIDEIKAARDKALALRTGTEKHITDPALLKKNATSKGVSEDFYAQSVRDKIAAQDVGIKKLNDFLALAEPKVKSAEPVVRKPKTTVPEASPKVAEALSTPAVVQEPTPAEEPVSEAPIEPEPQEIAAPKPVAEEPPIGTRGFPTSEIVAEEPAVAEDLPQKNIPNTSLLEIPFDTVRYDDNLKKAINSSGKNQIIDYGGRKIVVVNVNGVNVPFYLSTGLGGKAGVAAGKWYPFFGIGQDGWINKTSESDINDYYGVDALRSVAESLDRSIGDIRNDQSIPKVKATGSHIDFINRDMSPAENQTPETLDRVNANIANVRNRVVGESNQFAESAPITTRPDATPEQLTDLQQEPFGAPIGLRNMTPEQKATYEAERDKRFPPVPLDLSAGQTTGIEPLRVTPRIGTAFGEVNLKPEVKAVQDRINSELNARLRDIAPPTTILQTQQFIDHGEGYLVHGTHNDGVINIALGIYDPNLSVEDHIKKLMGVLNHETIHAVRNRIRPSEWKILSKAVENTKIPGKKYTYLDKAQAIYTPDLSLAYADPDAVIEEAVAEMYKDWYNKQQAPNNTRGLFNRITEILRRVFRVLKSSKYEDVFKSIEAGQMRDREATQVENRGVTFSAAPVTESEEFKNWNAGNQLVDENGNPLKLYTGTSKDTIFESFKDSDRGTWVTTDPETASEYSMQNDSMGNKRVGWSFEPTNTASRVIPLYGRATNILDLSTNEKQDAYMAENKIAKFSGVNGYQKEQAAIGRKAMASGYDAIKWAPNVWAVFNAKKNLKSQFNPFTEKSIASPKFSAAPALDTDEFKNWFKGSKIVNRDGTPRVVYHGTDEEVRFTAFNPNISEFGTHFGTARQANEFATVANEKDIRRNGRVFPVYLSIKNPLRLVDYGSFSTAKVAPQLLEKGIISRDLFEELESNPSEDDVRVKLREAMRKSGYDGIVYLNRAEGLNKGSLNSLEDADLDWQDITDQKFKAYIPEAEDSYIIFDPRQAKSVLNEFKPGEANRLSFSAAPLPTYLEQQNQHIFAPVPNVSFKDMVFDFFGYGQNTVGKTLNTQRGTITISDKTMRNISRRMNVVDRNAYIAHLEKLANEQDSGQFERMVADDSALAALVWRGRASLINASMIIKGKLTLNYARPGDLLSATMKVEDDPDSLLNIAKILLEPGPTKADGTQDDNRTLFKMYATAKRAIGLKADGKPYPAGITDKYIKDTISLVEQSHPNVAKAYQMYQRFNKNLLTTAVNAGVISQQELADLTKRMDYYGYYREAYQEDIVPTSSNKTASRFNLREYKGSQRGGLINDPLYVMLQNSHFWVDSIAKNIAATKSFNLLRRMDEARILQTGEKPNRDAGEEDQVMFFMDKGVLKRFAVKDPMLAVALGSDDRIDMGSMMKWLSMPTQILRESVTRDPGFMFANLARDTMSTWVTSGESIIPFIDTVKGFKTALTNGASFQELMGRGVVGSYDLGMKDPKDLAATIARRAAPKNIHMITNPQGLINVTQSLWDKMGSLSEASDAATRVAVYEAARAQGMSEAEASLRAIEIMDFSRHGSNQILSVLTKLVPFLNARIQGIDVLYQAAKAGGKFIAGKQQSERDAQIGKRFLVRGGILAVISMALEMLNEDDEDYRGLEDYIKNSNVLIPLKHFGLKGEFIAIPKPFESGLIFSTFPQQFYKSMQGDATTRENIGLFTSSIASTFGVNPIPQLLLPGIEVLTNHDFYTGLPLIPEGKSRLAPELQYNASTSSLAMLIGKIPVMYNLTSGKFEGISPIVIDNLIGGYGGPLGTYISQAVSIGMETANVGPERLPQDVTRLPIVRRFFIDAESKNPKVVSQAYELFGLADEANRSFSRLRQMGDVEATMAYVEENKDILSYKKYIFKLVDGLNKISARERAIERDGSMTRDEKFAAMKNLRDMKIQIATKVADINKVLGR